MILFKTIERDILELIKKFLAQYTFLTEASWLPMKSLSVQHKWYCPVSIIEPEEILRMYVC